MLSVRFAGALLGVLLISPTVTEIIFHIDFIFVISSLVTVGILELLVL